jgi:nicotinamidase/pyrazinamidase
MNLLLEPRRGLTVVDLAKDFCEGGSLPIKGGNRAAEETAEYIKNNRHKYDLIIGTRDWHNDYPDTNCGHFAEQMSRPDYNFTWPAHCVKNTPGAQFHPAIDPGFFDLIVSKGQGVPAYSAFDGSVSWSNSSWDCVGASLRSVLMGMKITELDVVGLAFDFCVKQTALDAKVVLASLDQNAVVRILKPLTASVHPDRDTYEMLYLEEKGIRVLSSLPTAA